MISFDSITYSVDESAGVVIISIENMTPEMERDVVVQVYTVDGHATGIQYFLISRHIHCI